MICSSLKVDLHVEVPQTSQTLQQLKMTCHFVLTESSRCSFPSVNNSEGSGSTRDVNPFSITLHKHSSSLSTAVCIAFLVCCHYYCCVTKWMVREDKHWFHLVCVTCKKRTQTQHFLNAQRYSVISSYTACTCTPPYSTFPSQAVRRYSKFCYVWKIFYKNMTSIQFVT